MTEAIDKQARDSLEAHKDICAVRYEGINSSIGNLNRKMDTHQKHMDNQIGILRRTINNYVVGLLVFTVMTLMSISAYLYIENTKRDNKYLEDIANEQILNRYKLK